MSYQVPLEEPALRSVLDLVDNLVARGLMPSNSVEIETVRRLVRDYRTIQDNGKRRRSYLKEVGIGYLTDTIMVGTKQIAEEILAKCDRPDIASYVLSALGVRMARVFLGREAP